MALLHPLAGSRFAVTMRSVRAHGGIAPEAAPAAVIMAVSHGLRFLSCELENIRARRLARLNPPMPDPVFIVGHWRSGTTLLANLMSFDDGYFYPGLLEAVSPHDFFPSPLEKLSRRWLPLLFPEDRPFDSARVPMRQPFPQEDEMAMAALGAPSFFNAFYFPQTARQTIMREVFFDGLEEKGVGNWKTAHEGFIRKLALLHPGKRPLLKNPAHSARLLHLHGLYPSARFVMLRRDANEVAASTCRLFEKLWPMLALQRYDLAAIPLLVRDLQLRMEEKIGENWPKLPPDQRLEVDFTALVERPSATVCAVQEWLGRTADNQLRRRIEDYMQANSPA